MGKVISVMNEKGGVAKTTTVKNVAAKLAMLGKKVLAIDLDSSANLTIAFGYRRPEKLHETAFDIFAKCIEYEEILEGYAILHNEEGVDLVPSAPDMHRMEDMLENVMQKELVLGRYIEAVRDRYDYILIDCPGGLGLFVVNALFCTDSVIIPTMPHFLDIQAVQNLFQLIARVKKCRRSQMPKIDGIVFTMVRNTTNDSHIMKEIRAGYEGVVPVYGATLPMAVKETETAAAGQSIYMYAPETAIARAYSQFTEEVLSNG